MSVLVVVFLIRLLVIDGVRGSECMRALRATQYQYLRSIEHARLIAPAHRAASVFAYATLNHFSIYHKYSIELQDRASPFSFRWPIASDCEMGKKGNTQSAHECGLV